MAETLLELRDFLEILIGELETQRVLFNGFEDVNVVDLDNDGPESQLITALESFYRGIKL